MPWAGRMQGPVDNLAAPHHDRARDREHWSQTMHVVSIYNNKGGVGKSTLAVGIAEFLASNRKKRVLVIDLDAQASSSGSLLGRRALTEAIQNRRTVAELVGEAARTGRVVEKPSDFFTTRAASTT